MRPLADYRGGWLRQDPTLAHRVVHLIEQGPHPGHMLLLTFSRRAAQKWSGGSSASS